MLIAVPTQRESDLVFPFAVVQGRAYSTPKQVFDHCVGMRLAPRLPSNAEDFFDAVGHSVPRARTPVKTQYSRKKVGHNTTREKEVTSAASRDRKVNRSVLYRSHVLLGYMIEAWLSMERIQRTYWHLRLLSKRQSHFLAPEPLFRYLAATAVDR